MEMTRAILVAVALSSLVVGGKAEATFPFDGNQIYADCQEPDDVRKPVAWGFCTGYISWG